ncbi:MAG: dienelactone hydrolase family protein [Marinicella sp.]
MRNLSVCLALVLYTLSTLQANLFCLLVLMATPVLADKPPESERAEPSHTVLIDDFPSPYDDQDIELEALIWQPQGDGPYPAIIMMHGSGGLYYQSDDQCEDDDRSCWGLSGKFKYWGKQLSQSHQFELTDQFLVIAVDSHTPRGYDHHGVANIDAEDRPLNVSSYLGRPWDLYAAFQYLLTRDDIDPDAIFALGFSDGGGAVLSSVAASDNAALVNQSNWFEGIDNNSPAGWLQMQEIGLKGAVAYYPSCGFFGHFDGLYTTYAPLKIQTGLDDNTTPITACIERQQDAVDLGVSSQDMVVLGYPAMDHGFDYEQYETPESCLAAKRTVEFFSHQLVDFLFRSNFDPVNCN